MATLQEQFILILPEEALVFLTTSEYVNDARVISLQADQILLRAENRSAILIDLVYISPVLTGHVLVFAKHSRSLHEVEEGTILLFYVNFRQHIALIVWTRLIRLVVNELLVLSNLVLKEHDKIVVFL